MKRRNSIVAFITLAIVLWFGRFFLSSRFGFYEDDYTLVVRAMDSDWQTTWQFIVDLLIHFKGQGRPLQHALIFLLSHLVGRTASIPFAYDIAYLIVLANSCLFFKFSKGLIDERFALVAAFFYILYSADTTQAFLYHAYGLQQSLTFFLLASLAFAAGKRRASYVLIAGSLLSYEATFFVFLGIPLLLEKWDRPLLRGLMRHILILAAIFSSILLLRILTGEGRVSSLTWPAMLTVPLQHMFQGPLVSLGTNLLRSFQTLESRNALVYLIAIAGIAAFFGIFSLMTRDDANMNAATEENRPQKERSDSRVDLLLHSNARIWRLSRIMLVAIVLTILAYPLTFTVRAYAISGRDTRVHFGAIIGYSLFWSSLWCLLLEFHGKRRHKIILLLLSINLGLMLGFGAIIQEDYVRSWQYQKQLWRSIVPYIPDLADGTTIFIDPQGLLDTKYIDANTWSLPRVLQYLLTFPDDWETPPEVVRLLPDWTTRSLTNDIELKAVDYTWNYVVSPWENTVILLSERNEIVRRLREITLDGKTYSLKDPRGMQSPRFPCGILARAMLEEGPKALIDLCTMDGTSGKN